MTRPDFDLMSHQELQTYVLEHRDDQEAFYALVDRFHAEPEHWHSPLDPTADIDRFEELLAEHQRKQAALAEEKEEWERQRLQKVFEKKEKERK